MNDTSSFEEQAHFQKRLRQIVTAGLVLTTIIGVAVFVYVKSNPMIFNESFFGHAHCISAAGSSLGIYANDNSGKFPFHTNGFGDAVLMLLKHTQQTSVYFLTGPNDDGRILHDALIKGTDVPENLCSRIYVQGLSISNDASIAILFDRNPSPGGDHCGGFRRMFAPLTREVLFVDGSHKSIAETRWPEFVTNQIKLLVDAGFTRSDAETLYASTLRPSHATKSP